MDVGRRVEAGRRPEPAPCEAGRGCGQARFRRAAFDFFFLRTLGLS